MNLTTFEQLENQPTKTLLLKVMKVENAAADHGKVVPWLNEVIASSFVSEDPLILRHAVGNYYAAATRVSTEGELFRWQTTYHWTLLKFRDAVLRRCHGIRRHYVARKHTHLVSVVSETERMAYPELVGITEEGFYNLNPKLTAEIDKAAADAATRSQHTEPPPNRNRQRCRPPRGGGAAGAP